MIEIIVVPLTPTLPNAELFGEQDSTKSALARQIKAKASIGSFLDMGFRLFASHEVKDDFGIALVYILYKPSPPPIPEVETL